MNKQLIYKYLEGELSSQQEKELFAWVSKSEQHKDFCASQMNIWIMQHTPDTKANEQDYLQMKKFIEQSTPNKSSSISKKKTITLRTSFFYPAAAVAILFVLINTVLVINSLRTSDSTKATIATNIVKGTKSKQYQGFRELYTEKGVKAKIILPDSSIVWLNSDSKIMYPSEFSGDKREIYFSGEAYFDVFKDSLKPMIINGKNNFTVKVLGTKFNLKNYSNDNDVRVTLYSGSVEVFKDKGDNRISHALLKPSETLTIKDRGEIDVVKLDDPEEFSLWKEGKLNFNDTKLADVVKVLERWHGVSIEVKDNSILDYKFTAQFNSESIVQIMEFMKMVSYIDYTVIGNKVILTKR